MKTIVFFLVVMFNLNAGTHVKIVNKFNKNISVANAVIKKGYYDKYQEYKNGIESTISHVHKLDISQKEKLELKKDIQTYASIINNIYTKLYEKAPRFKEHYKNSTYNKYSFNKKISSIGYRPIIRAWYELSKIKSIYIKRPSEKLEKRFYKKLQFMITNITELYLDEEIEEPLFAYLDNYKMYFDEVKIGYMSVDYENIKKLKPLCYKIKAKLEFLDAI